MNLYTPQFNPSLDSNAPTETITTLFIASTPRSGSHMLGHALGKTGLVSIPFEYCNPANMTEWKRLLGLADTQKVILEIMRRRTNTTGIFSIKAHLSQSSALGGPDEMLRFFPNPKIIFIRRPDILRQAISYSVAMQTKVWIDGQEPIGITPSYNFRQIAKCLENIAVQNARWTSAFSRCGLMPLYVDFDLLKKNLPGELSRILRFMGIEVLPEDLPKAAPTKPQGVSSQTDDWVQRFSEDTGRIGWPRAPSAFAAYFLRRLRSVTGLR